MARRSKAKQRSPVSGLTRKTDVRRHEPETDNSLRTGSRAPSELLPRALEASIGFEVRRLRKSMDLTVAQLGLMAGISAGMLSKIENGTISPSLSTLSALEVTHPAKATQPCG